LPIAFDTDRECIENGYLTCWQPKRDAVRMALIANTLELAELWVSPALLDDVKRHSHLEVLGDPRALPFDETGNLLQKTLFPHSVRGRR
jgi:hypothetical protein